MQKSMTGYGRGMADRDGRFLTLELKSVNHRFLDISMRLPRTLMFADEIVRSAITKRLKRGHIDVFAKYENKRDDTKSVRMDESLLVAYHEKCSKASELTKINNDTRLIELLKMPEVLVAEENQEDQEEIAILFQTACDRALDQMIIMRGIEGEKMAEDVLQNSETLAVLLDEIETLFPHSIEIYKEKLNIRITELVQNGGVIDGGRLEAEVAMFCDRAAIDEEIIRLRSHIDQIKTILSENEASGRKLDFVVQELNREFNTIGSKSNDLKISNNVLQAKSIIEKIREQVQNIE